MRNEFYKVISNLDRILDDDKDLLFLEQWLEKLLNKYFKYFFNPIAIITATQRTKTDNKHQKKDKERKQVNSFHNSTPKSPDKRKETIKFK